MILRSISKFTIWMISVLNIIPGEAGIALNMRSQISMFLDVLRTLDHEKVASKIQKALNWSTGCGKTILPSLNMPMEHPKKPATRRFDHIWGLVHCLPDRDLG